MKLFIAADHAGFSLKEELKANSEKLGIQFQDLGTTSLDSVDYPDYADQLSKAIIQNQGTLGILICGSGIGVSIAANRHPQIRAVLAESALVAKLGREHNHANVLCLGARIVSLEKAIEIIQAFLSATPDLGERHVRRIEKLSKEPAKHE